MPETSVDAKRSHSCSVLEYGGVWKSLKHDNKTAFPDGPEELHMITQPNPSPSDASKRAMSSTCMFAISSALRVIVTSDILFHQPDMMVVIKIV